MKKLTLLAALVATASMAFGQGNVQFANTTSTRLTTNQNITTPNATGNIHGGNAYVIGLFVGPAGSTFSSLQPVGYTGNSGTVSGTFGLSPYALPAPYDGSAAVAYQIRAWSAGFGADWATVSAKVPGWTGTGNATANFAFTPGAYFLGASAIGSVLPATGTTLPPALFGAGAGQVGAFALMEVIPTPEPGTLALIGLGLTGLLFIRRRK